MGGLVALYLIPEIGPDVSRSVAREPVDSLNVR